jgi:hypothetical protein
LLVVACGCLWLLVVACGGRGGCGGLVVDGGTFTNVSYSRNLVLLVFPQARYI